MKVHPKANVHIHDPVLREAYSHNQTRVILMRNPFDDIWSWYKLEQTTLGVSSQGTFGNITSLTCN